MNAENFITQIEIFYNAKYQSLQKSFMLEEINKFSEDYLLQFYKEKILFKTFCKTVDKPLPLLNDLEVAKRNFVYYPKAIGLIENISENASQEECDNFFRKWRDAVRLKNINSKIKGGNK